uniref:Cytochrome c biogenesis protein CcsA n=1 Tax=Dianyuea turbinata TaxID=1839802 RepID=A0A7S9DEE0_9ROSI|nr:cytochrome c heme attachment protein [Dianyuea turbinata]QPF96093.1 cytochrome c heme attachment protein [Dianyuea turbinata]
MIFFTLEHILTHISFSVVSIVIIIHFISLLVNEFVRLYDSSEKGMLTAFFCLTVLLISRWSCSGHLPISDLYESLIFLSWGFSIIYMVPYFKKHKNYLSTIIAPSTFFTQGFATWSLLTDMHQSEILVPALQSQWLIMHVSMMVSGYAALLCGSLFSVALIVIAFRKVIRILNKSKDLLNDSLNYYRFQLIQQLDHWGSRILSIGFIFLTIGILSGAVWANEAWGSYWNWDPKETWAFITWTIFAIYFHTRTNKNWEGLINSAIVASIGFLIIWICYFGVNLLGIGLHSYGSFTLISN